MPRNRLGYVNRSALIDRGAVHDHANHDRFKSGPDGAIPAKPDDVHCPPMTHQNSGSHGHEMYPQQFVRLIGCHDTSLETLLKRQDEKLH